MNLLILFAKSVRRVGLWFVSLAMFDKTIEATIEFEQPHDHQERAWSDSLNRPLCILAGTAIYHVPMGPVKRYGPTDTD